MTLDRRPPDRPAQVCAPRPVGIAVGPVGGHYFSSYAATVFAKNVGTYTTRFFAS